METFFPQNLHRGSGPLAARMRPSHFAEFAGQKELLAKLAEAKLHSMLLYGPPGCGKSSLALLLLQKAKHAPSSLSAISTNVKEIRSIIEEGKRLFLEGGEGLVLFLDEIHRFSRSQQDSLLAGVEEGWIILIGASTEHPGFEITAPLLSRIKVYELKPLGEAELEWILKHSLEKDPEISSYHLEEGAKKLLLESSGGDARKMLRNLELAASLAQMEQNKAPVRDAEKPYTVSHEIIAQLVSGEQRLYEKKGSSRYDCISAFIKSLRGSDPDAALLYMAAMLDGGEDPLFIARRMLIFAAEDIGNASPTALQLATSTFMAVERIGLPEGRIPLGQCALFLAASPKSNASYLAIDAALAAVKGRALHVPPYLCNAPTSLHKKEGKGQAYRYPHNFRDHFIHEEYLPKAFQKAQFYHPSMQGKEAHIQARLAKLWPMRSYKAPE